MAGFGLGRRAEDRGLELGLSARPEASFSPASVPCAAYSFHADPER